MRMHKVSCACRAQSCLDLSSYTQACRHHAPALPALHSACRQGPDKMVGIVRKTWAKTGPKGRAAAAALLPQLPPDQADIVARALA